jgi:Tol biopolymer transport system component
MAGSRARVALRSRSLQFAVAALAAVLAWPTAPARAVFPGRDGAIAYVSAGIPGQPDGMYEIPAGGGAPVQLNSDPLDSNPSWSADGQHLVFIRSLQGLVTMDGNGEHQDQLFHSRGNWLSSPSFSPNGTQIAYTRDNEPVASSTRKRRYSIGVVGSDGGSRRVIFHARAPGYVSGLAWTPNGANIVFAGGPPGSSRGISEIQSDGSRLRELTSPSKLRYDEAPTYLRDGSHIAFVRCYVDDRYCGGPLMVMRPDGSHLHRLSSLDGSAPVYAIAPAGDRVVLVREEGGDFPDCSDLITTDLSGSNMQSLTHNCDDSTGYAHDPAWQPLP